MRKLYFLPLFLLSFLFSAAQSDCSSAIIACGNTRPFNPSGVGTKLEQLACGGIEHNSVWVAFQAKANGKLNFVIRPFTLAGLPTAADVDWSLFQLAGPPGSGNCDARTQISCNFAGVSTVFGIPGATGMATPPYVSSAFNPGVDVTSGTWYALIIDQFSNTTPLLFSVQFTGNPESSYLNSTPGIFDNRPDFSIVNNSGCGGSFDFSSSSVATSGIASYAWNFGDGSTSTLANPSHTYASTGTYYVTLTVTDNNGCASDIRKTVVFNNTAPVMNATGILSTPSCSDANNGTLTVSTIGATTLGVSGGTAPYTYELVSPSPMIRPSQASNSFTGLQPGTYTVKATDACGKSATANVTVTQVLTNSTIGLGIQNIQSACTGSATGSATIFANGAAPPITMALVATSPVTTGPLPSIQRDPVTATFFTTFNNLLPGVYTVEAIDACGKARRATFTVTPSTAPLANSINSPSCAGTATGTITVSATAGTGLSGAGSPGTYQYALVTPSPVTRPFQNSSFFQNLLPGTYTVAVKDACGNVGTSTTTIATAPAPNFGTSFTSISCPNGSTGTIEVQNGTVAGGGSPYTYELIAPSTVTRPSQNSNLFANLPPGSYTVRMTDACATSAITTVTVGAASAPTFTSTVTASCASPASGTLTVAPSATAIGPFSFELVSPGTAIRAPQGSNVANTNSSFFKDLSQGAYTIRMTDGCGVPVTGTATITAPTALAFPAGSASTPSCPAGSTGQITVAVPTTGSGAYRYELIAPSPVTRAPQYSRIFNGLPVGNYVIRITDSCGTQVDNSASPLAITAAATPSLTVTNTASCATSSGTITCLSNNNQGGGTYQFALIAPSPVTRPNQTAPTFTGLPDGNYTVQITDQCGQTGTISTTIALAGAFTPQAGGSVVSCTGANYNAQIIVTNPQNFTPGGPIPPGSGGGPYTYALYDATNTTLLAGPQSSNVFMVVVPAAGNPSHTIRVTDGCGNTSTATTAVNPPAALAAATVSVVASSCASSATGVIRVTTSSSGGLAPYSYTLIDAVTTAVVAGPQSGVVFEGIAANATGYLVRTTDACGNVVVSAAPLLFPAAVTPTATVATIASCASPSSGRITVTPGTGSTFGGGAFTYALYDVTNTTLIRAAQASPVFASVAPGDYTVRITDRCGTTGTVTANVASGVAAPTASGTATATCTGGSNGVIRGISGGGSGPVTFTLLEQPAGTVYAGPQADSVFNGLPAGTYAVRVTDACGTVTNSADIVVANSALTPTITVSQALDCAGTATLGAYGAGGNGGAFTYAICSGAGCTGFGSFTGTSTFVVNTSGTYRIAVNDRCNTQTISADIVVSIPSKPSLTGITKASNCGTTTITPSFTGISNTPYYSLDGSNFSPTIPSVSSGCHTLRVSDYNAGVYGCASDAFDVSIFSPPALRTASPLSGWTVNCATSSVTPALSPATGETGCAGSGASLGVKLVSCVGCTVSADPVGTVKAPGVSFNLSGATSAVFAPVIVVGAADICSGTTETANFLNPLTFNCPFTLPVTVEYFKGKAVSGEHLLDWKVNYSGPAGSVFTIELERSSSPGGMFNTLYRTTADQSRALQPFAYTDVQPVKGMNYYRLKITETGGVVRYSQVVALRSSHNAFDIVSLLPNPVKRNGEAILVIASSDRKQVELVISDLTGKQLQVRQVWLSDGNNSFTLNTNAFAAGVYHVLVRSNDGMRQAIRFVKE